MNSTNSTSSPTWQWQWQLPSFVSNCGGREINCTYSNGVIEADPDIAGIGVLISFIATSIITFVAIIVGYVTCSLDRELTNEVDAIAVRSFRRLCRMGDGTNILPRERETRNEMMTRFILALSDQQLVTGLAILITGYSKRCEISGYHFNIVTNLAWFSSTTHLSTLAVLRGYFLHHTLLKTCRVIGMLAILGMLFHAQMYAQWFIIPSLPMQCTFVVGFPSQNDIWGGPVGLISLSKPLQWLGILAYLLLAYGNNLVCLFAARPARSLLDWVGQLARKKLGLGPMIFLKQSLEAHLAKVDPPDNSTSVRPVHPGLHCAYYWLECMDSFLWEIVWMIFGNTFGILQLYNIRTSQLSNYSNYYGALQEGSLYEVVGNESAMSFGQMIALILLALPLLAAAEGYFDINLKTPEITSAPSRDGHSQATSNGPLVYRINAYMMGLFVFVITTLLVLFAVDAGYIQNSWNHSWLSFIFFSICCAFIIVFLNIVMRVVWLLNTRTEEEHDQLKIWRCLEDRP